MDNRKEHETVALAWRWATNNGIQGADQKGKDFHNKIHATFKANSPRDAPPGRFGDHRPQGNLRIPTWPSLSRHQQV
jgi:hypothetical protein